jgi:aminoglycoside phosphotransferase (APT) family kinase protein
MHSAPVESAARPKDATLIEAVFPALAALSGRVPTSLTRAAFDYSTSAEIELLKIAFADAGHPVELLLKNLSARALLPPARGVRPHFLPAASNEIIAYQTFLSSADLGTPRCLAAFNDAVRDVAWIVLEKIDGNPLAHVGDFSAWTEAAIWLATLHGTPAGNATLPRYDRAYFLTWLDHAERLLRSSPPATPAVARDRRRLLDAYASVIDALATLPCAVVHGEYYAANILIRETPAPQRVCPIDWATAGIGPRALDLAALTSGDWPDDERIAMVAAYHRAAPHWPMRELTHHVDLCRLHIAVQWAFWAVDWDAPQDQQHDWLAEGLQAAEQI